MPAALSDNRNSIGSVSVWKRSTNSSRRDFDSPPWSHSTGRSRCAARYGCSIVPNSEYCVNTSALSPVITVGVARPVRTRSSEISSAAAM